MNILRNNRLPKLLSSRWFLQQCHGRNNSSNSITEKKFIIEPLEQRKLIRVKGEDVISFLQGLTTNDMRQLQVSPSASIYTMFLNKAGRVLYDAIMYRTPAEESTILIECDQDISNELMRHLKLYRVRRKIQIDNIAEELNIWSLFNAHEDPAVNRLNSAEMPTSMEDIVIVQDPRLSCLGHRLLTPADTTSTDLSNMYKDLCQVNVEGPSSEYNYRLHRYTVGVAEGVLDMPPGKQFPLEANCDLLNGVSFNKGCYVGQELTARVHHTGVIRKRHMPVILNAPLSPKTSNAIFNEAGAKVGNILGSTKNHAIGLLRIEQVVKAKELKIDGNVCCVEKPKWWPATL